VRAVVVAVMLCGCDLVWNTRALPDGPVVGTCHDTFDGGGDPCGTWGHVDGVGGRIYRDGTLEVMPAANIVGNNLGCNSNTPVPFTTATTKVIGTVGGSGYTTLSVEGPAPVDGLEISKGENAMLSIYSTDDFNNSKMDKPYSAANMLWWRLRADAGQIAAETSPDAQAWTTLYRYTPPDGLPATVVVSVGAGTSKAEATPGIAMFDQIDLCDHL
jgi:hypothetical protein